MAFASHEPPKLSFLERVGLIVGVPLLVARFLFRFAWITPSRWLAGWPLRRTVASCLLYGIDATYTHRQRLARLPSTGQQIRDHCEPLGMMVQTREFDCGPDAPPAAWHTIWLTTKKDYVVKTSRVLVWLHGGGYEMPLAALAQLNTAIKYAEATGMAQVIFLEYRLAPMLQYPGQLIQGIEGLRNLIEVQGYGPSRIILAGDSAGGNLALGVLAHAIQPSPYAPPFKIFSASTSPKLRGLLLMSPWVTIPVDSQSYRENGGTDIINSTSMQAFTDLWAPKNEPWANLLLVKPETWQKLLVENVIVSAGDWEVFRDDILELAKSMGLEEEADARWRLVVGEAEFHVQPEVDCAGGIPLMGSAVALMSWMKSVAM